MTVEEKILELENNCKVITAEIDKLKAELAEKNETVWEPKHSDPYYYVGTAGRVNSDTWVDDICDKERAKFNNVYQLNNETQKHLTWYRDNVLRVQNRLMQLHELLCPDYFPDWENKEAKFFLCYSYGYGKNRWNYERMCSIYNCVVCFDKEAAEKACKILNREKFMMDNV